MKVTTVLLVACMVTLWPILGHAQSAGEGKAEQAVRTSAAQFVEAFNQGDADAIAALWADDAEYLAPDGNHYVGREAIRELYAQIFTDTPGLQLQVDDLVVRVGAAGVAFEEGTATVLEEGTPIDTTRYTARHIQEDGGWKLAHVQEIDADQPSQYEHLKALSWMVGSWVDQSEDAAIETRCQWSRNQNFLTRYFTVRVDGAVAHEGMQIIGFHAPSGEIRSWVFDSDGGTGQGIWSNQDNQWTVAVTYNLPDGGQGKATNTFTRVDDDHFRFQSTQRSIDGEALPDVPEVTATRIE